MENSNSPDVAFEAMACGLPVIASSKSGAAELLPDCDAGLVYRDDKLHGSGAILRYVHGLAEEPGALVPGHNRVTTGRRSGKRKSSRTVRFGTPLIGADDDRRGHIRMKVTMHEDNPRLGESNRARMILWIISQIERLRVRKREDIVKNRIEVGE